MIYKEFFKNLSVHKLSLFTAGAFSVLAILVSLGYFGLNHYVKHPIIVGLFLLLITFLGAYAIIQYVLRRFIFRRIKLIYKRIQKSKVSMPSTLTSRQDDNILNEVEQDVEIWANAKADEIETLKTLENYRKRFLGDVSHELKTPIFSIQGYIFTLLDGGLYDENINRKYLKRAAKNVDRLLTIVNDLDEISKLDSGELAMNFVVFDIKELVDEVFADLNIQAEKNNISLVFKEGADRPFKVKGDRKYIQIVLSNLITNSIKYGHENGQTKISLYDMDKHILVEVADNGIGIEAKHLSHLFDRFYRVDSSRSRDSGGSGLGLAIVKYILEAHQQTINVRSTPELGSTFNFTLEKG